MPFVGPGEALDLPFVDLEAVARDLGPPPARACLVGTPRLRVVLLRWPPGFVSRPHRHPWAEEIFIVLDGRAVFEIGDEPAREVGPGELVLALRDVRHAIRVPAGEPATILAAVAPNEDRPDETVESDR